VRDNGPPRLKWHVSQIHMGILARLLGAVPKEEQGGIRLKDDNPWRVEPTRDFERFLRALPMLCSERGVAYFEGTGEPHVTEYLSARAMPPSVRVAVGTIWPRPDTFHLPLTRTAMEDFAAFLERRPAGYLCTHCHVLCDGAILLQWHDAFGSDPMYLPHGLAEDMVASFAQAIGCSYAQGWL